MRKLMMCLSIVGLGLIAGGASAEDNWVGTWKINAAKSKVGPNAMRTQTLTFEATADGLTLTSDSTDADGKPVHGTYTSKFDGKEVAWTGNPMADTATPKRIDSNNYENAWKLAGKVTIHSKVSVSKDGKTLTISQKGTNAKGAPVDVVAVYDRQ